MYAVSSIKVRRIEYVAMAFVICAVCLAWCGTANAVCRPANARISMDEANDFLKNPDRLLQQGVDGLPRITHAVTQLATGGPASGLVPLRPIFAKGNPRQQAAVALGLYKAVMVCQQVNVIDAAAIEAVLRNMGDQALLDAYRRARAKAEDPDVSASDVAAQAASTSFAAKRASDARLLSLMPGLQTNGSLELSNPTSLPGE